MTGYSEFYCIYAQVWHPETRLDVMEGTKKYPCFHLGYLVPITDMGGMSPSFLSNYMHRLFYKKFLEDDMVNLYLVSTPDNFYHRKVSVWDVPALFPLGYTHEWEIQIA